MAKKTSFYPRSVKVYRCSSRQRGGWKALRPTRKASRYTLCGLGYGATLCAENEKNADGQSLAVQKKLSSAGAQSETSTQGSVPMSVER